jgi:hypothetical protein
MGRFGILTAVVLASLAPMAAQAVIVTTIPSVSTPGNVTPGVIFGDGNANGSFTMATAGGVELGLRAKLRYDATTNCSGFGCPQNTFNHDGVQSYSFLTTGSNPPPGQSVFNFEWSISALVGGLDALSFILTVDTDPSAVNNSLLAYNPLAFPAHFGTPLTGSASVTESMVAAQDLGGYTVAQNSVNMGFLTAPAAPIEVPLGVGQFTFTLSAYDGALLKNSTSIDVFVSAPSPVPLPAGGVLLIGALGGLAALRRRAKRAGTVASTNS